MMQKEGKLIFSDLKIDEISEVVDESEDVIPSVSEIEAFFAEEREEKEILEKLNILAKLFKKNGYRGYTSDEKLMNIIMRISALSEPITIRVLTIFIFILENKSTLIDKIPITDIIELTKSLLQSEQPSLIFFALQLIAFITKKECFIEVIFETIDFDSFMEIIQDSCSKDGKLAYWALNSICNFLYYKHDIDEENVSKLLTAILCVFQTKDPTLILIALDIIINLTAFDTYRNVIDESELIPYIISFIEPAHPRNAKASILILTNLFESGLCLESDAIPQIILTMKLSTTNVQIKGIRAIKTYVAQCPESLPILCEIGLFDLLNELFEKEQFIIQKEIILFISSVAQNEEACNIIISFCDFINQVITLVNCEDVEIVLNIINILSILVQFQLTSGITELQEELQQNQETIEDLISSTNTDISARAEELNDLIFPPQNDE